jgi:Major Facilitator Superfamily
MVPPVTDGKIGGEGVPRLNPVRAVSSLIPNPGPRRPYALAMLINSFGFGLAMVSMPLYYTRIVHLSVGQVGLGLTIAIASGLLMGVPIGTLADKRGPLEVAMALLLVQCGTALGWLFIRNFASFVAVAVVHTLAVTASLSADGSLMRRVGGEDAAGFRASTHSIFNLGVALGAGCSAVTIQLGTPTAYRALIILDALSFLGALAALRRLPHYDPLPKPATAPRLGVLADRPFVAYTALAGAISMQTAVLSPLLPLWVAYDTHAPRWCIPMFLLINTILVVLFQVRIGSRVQTIRQGGLAMRRAGVIFLFSCSVIGFAAGLPGWAALIMLVAGVCLHTFGEIWHMSGSFALDFGLPPAHAQGQYVGFVGLGTGIAGAAAPVLLLGLVLSLGRPGLLGLGAYFALVGLLVPTVARWGERTRQASPDFASVEGADVEGADVEGADVEGAAVAE